MKKEAKRANILSISGNLLLFVFKLVLGFMTNSIAVISDAMNSFMDSLTSIIVYFCMKLSLKHPDENHPFGHHRAEPLAAMLIAVLTAVVGVQILQSAFHRLFEPADIHISLIILLIYPIALIIKGFLFFYTKHATTKTKSEALKALLVDHRNDSLISLSVIISFFAIRAGYYIVDPIIGFFIAGYILKSGWTIGLQNIKYLMGETPSKELLRKIRSKARSVKEVEKVNRIKAHYVGLLLNVEIHIKVDKKMSLVKAHNIGEKVEKEVEKLSEVERAFVHIDPI